MKAASGAPRRSAFGTAPTACTLRVQKWPIGDQSVRAPGNLCAAVLDVDALRPGHLAKSQQTWACKANRSSV
jgi:hypothetical protein